MHGLEDTVTNKSIKSQLVSDAQAIHKDLFCRVTSTPGYTTRHINEFCLLTNSKNDLVYELKHRLKFGKVTITEHNHTRILVPETDILLPDSFSHPVYSLGNTRQLKNINVFYKDKAYTAKEFLKKVIAPRKKNSDKKPITTVREVLKYTGLEILTDNEKHLEVSLFCALIFYFSCFLKLSCRAGTDLYLMLDECADLARVAMLGHPNYFYQRLEKYDFKIGDLRERSVLTNSAFRHLLLANRYYHHIPTESGYVDSHGSKVNLGRPLLLNKIDLKTINEDKFRGFSSTIITTENVIMLARRVSKRSANRDTFQYFKFPAKSALGEKLKFDSLRIA